MKENVVVVKWGDRGAMQMAENLETLFSEDPYNLSAVDSNGDELVFKTFGTLLGCDGGTLTINEISYRIRVKQQQVSSIVSCCFFSIKINETPIGSHVIGSHLIDLDF